MIVVVDSGVVDEATSPIKLVEPRDSLPRPLLLCRNT